MKISIITTTFNSGKTLFKTINSVRNEKENTIGTIEYIIIDGKSVDNTVDIINENIDIVDIFINEHDYGIYNALNKGIRRASGDYVLFLASDDILLPGAISNFIMSVKSDTDVWCGSLIIYLDGYYKYLHPDNNLNSLFKECSLNNPASFFKRSIFYEYGFYDESYRSAADRELFLRLFNNKAIFQIEYIPIEFFNYGGISSKQPELYSVPEDREISIKYGMDKKYADLYYKKLLKKITKKNIIGRLIQFSKKIHLYKICCSICGKGNTFLSEDEIEYYIKEYVYDNKIA